jgi:hypothetical protein
MLSMIYYNQIEFELAVMKQKKVKAIQQLVDVYAKLGSRRSNFKNQRLSSELSKLTANAFCTTSFFHKRNERIQ